jgi:hypothetical protein
LDCQSTIPLFNTWIIGFWFESLSLHQEGFRQPVISWFLEKNPNLNRVGYNPARAVIAISMHQVISDSSRDFVLENGETGRKPMSTAFDESGLDYRGESTNDPVNLASRLPPKALFMRKGEQC